MWTNAHSQPFSAYYRQELTFAVGNGNSGIATQSCRLKICPCLYCLVFQQCSATARHKPVFYRRKKKERICSFQLLPDTPWPDCIGTETKDLVMPNFTRYKRGTHITVNIKIIWALSKSQWKDSRVKHRKKQRKCMSLFLQHDGSFSQEHSLISILLTRIIHATHPGGHSSSGKHNSWGLQLSRVNNLFPGVLCSCCWPLILQTCFTCFLGKAEAEMIKPNSNWSIQMGYQSN